MLRLTAHGLTGDVDRDQLAARFARDHTLRLPQLVDPAILGLARTALDSASWRLRTHGKIGRELEPEDQKASAALHFLVNTPEFLQLIRDLTRCAAAQRFQGRVYRFLPDPDHYDSWHDDVRPDRLIGMSINLSGERYEGGVFRVRDRQTHALLGRIASTGPGDTHIFRISDNLEHMVTAVSGRSPKTAFAGWFGPAATTYFSSLLSLRTGLGSD